MIRLARSCTLVALLATVALGAAAQSAASLDVATSMSFPVAENADLYRYGFGARLQARLPLGETPLYGGLSLGYDNVATEANDSLSLVTFAPALGVALPLGDVATWQTQLDIGAYLGIYGDEVGGNPAGVASSGLRFALSPGLSLGVLGSYSYYLT